MERTNNMTNGPRDAQNGELAELPKFEPSAETELLCSDLPNDPNGRVMKHLLRQVDVSQKQNCHIITEQRRGTHERQVVLSTVKEISQTVHANRSAFDAHVAADAKVFDEQARAHAAMCQEMRAGFTALKWVNPATYFNGKTISKILLAVLSAAVVALAMRHWNLK